MRCRCVGIPLDGHDFRRADAGLEMSIELRTRRIIEEDSQVFGAALGNRIRHGARSRSGRGVEVKHVVIERANGELELDAEADQRRIVEDRAIIRFE